VATRRHLHQGITRIGTLARPIRPNHRRVAKRHRRPRETLGKWGKNQGIRRVSDKDWSSTERAELDGRKEIVTRKRERDRHKKLPLVREGTACKDAAIADWLPTSITRSRSCVPNYGWSQGLLPVAGRRPCQRERADAELTHPDRQITPELHGYPGVRRIWAEMIVARRARRPQSGKKTHRRSTTHRRPG